MKILFTVEFYEPRKGGAEEVVKQLAERLAAAGHEVTAATSRVPERSFRELKGVRIEEFDLAGNEVNGVSGSDEEVARYRKFLSSGFDAVLNYAAQVWTTDLAFDVLPSLSAFKVLVPCGYSGLRNPRYSEYFRKLPGRLGAYDRLVYMSPNYQDKTFGDEHGFAEKAVIIPNGASAEEFLREDSFDVRKNLRITADHILISVSNHYLAKGHAFVIDAFRRMKREDAVLLLIGESRVSHGLRGIAHYLGDYLRCRLASVLDRRIRLVDGRERALVLSAYRSSDLFLFGSAVECAPLVMYESFAAKTGFITRPVGNVRDHSGVLKLVSTPAEMAAVANGLLDHPEELNALRERAFELWRSRHTWDVIARRYEKLFADHA